MDVQENNHNFTLKKVWLDHGYPSILSGKMEEALKIFWQFLHDLTVP